MDKTNQFSNDFSQQQQHMHRLSNGEPSGVSVELIHSLLGVNSGLPGNHISGLQQPSQPQIQNRQQYTNVPLPSLDISNSIVNNRQINSTTSNNNNNIINSSNQNSSSEANPLLEQMTFANPNLLNSILGTQQAHLVGNPFLFGLNGTGSGCGGSNNSTAYSGATNLNNSNNGHLMSVYQQNNNNSLLNNNNNMIGNTMGLQSMVQNTSNFPSSQQQFAHYSSFNNNYNQQPQQQQQQQQQQPQRTNHAGDAEDTNPTEDEYNELIIEQQKHINLLEGELVQARELINKLNDYVKTLEQKAAASKKQSRYWTQDEHQRFLEAIEKFGKKDVKAIAQYVGTRNATQVRTHAQKFYAKLDRDRAGVDQNKKKKKRSNKEGEESSSPLTSLDDENEDDEEDEALFLERPDVQLSQQQDDQQSFESKRETVQ